MSCRFGRGPCPIRRSLSPRARASFRGSWSTVDGEPVIGAVVECAPADKPDQKKYATTAVSGQFSLPALAFGDYLLKVTYLGMKPYAASVKIDKKQVQLGRLAMQPDVKQLGETVVEAVAMRTTQKGDTVVYNAGSYKVTQDASTDELLAKMPGIKVDGGTGRSAR